MARAKKNVRKDPSFREMKAEYFPVQRQVNLATSGGGTVYVLDVGRNLSVVNHRLYRQGKTYQLRLDIDNRADTNQRPAQYDVYALTDTWYVQKAWQLGRANYLKATADEREMMSEQKIARWEDFRVNPGITGALTVVPYQYTNALTGAANTDGEFAATEITLADGTTQRQYSWGVTTAGEFGLLFEYNKSGDTDGAPASVDPDNPYSGTDVGVHESQMDDLAGRGNLPPYNRTDFTDNVWVKVATLDNSGGANSGFSADARMSTGFFNAPCGLVVIVPSISHTLAGDLSMTVKAGKYKGVAAMNMGA